jgi:hypothetical protein
MKAACQVILTCTLHCLHIPTLCVAVMYQGNAFSAVQFLLPSEESSSRMKAFVQKTRVQSLCISLLLQVYRVGNRSAR